MDSPELCRQNNFLWNVHIQEKPKKVLVKCWSTGKSWITILFMFSSTGKLRQKQGDFFKAPPPLIKQKIILYFGRVTQTNLEKRFCPNVQIQKSPECFGKMFLCLQESLEISLVKCPHWKVVPLTSICFSISLQPCWVRFVLVAFIQRRGQNAEKHWLTEVFSTSLCTI